MPWRWGGKKEVSITLCLDWMKTNERKERENGKENEKYCTFPASGSAVCSRCEDWDLGENILWCHSSSLGFVQLLYIYININYQLLNKFPPFLLRATLWLWRYCLISATMAVTFSNLHSELGLKSLDGFLSGKTYISGYHTNSNTIH